MASSPPMSMMVETSGCIFFVNSVAAMTSWTKGISYLSDTPKPTEPVMESVNFSVVSVFFSSSKKAVMAPLTLAKWRLYEEYTTSPASFSTTIFAVVEPMSSPILNIQLPYVKISAKLDIKNEIANLMSIELIYRVATPFFS